MTVDLKQCSLAIDMCDPGSFENFVQAFHAAIVGSSFNPLGGFHDGGADGFEDRVFESETKASVFLQASKTDGINAKIRQTVKRLREFGRDPKQIIFYFSDSISTTDRIEEELTEELGTVIRIRSKAYLVAQMNYSAATIAAYNSYLSAAIASVLGVGTAGERRHYPFDARTLCAFLGQELQQRKSQATLLGTVTDTLILWALEGTDPEKGILYGRAEIQSKITAAVPTADKFIKGVFNTRLEALASKANPSGREISWHRKEDKFSLRFEERQKLVQDNIDDVALKSRVSDHLSESFYKHFLDADMQKLCTLAVAACHSTLEEIFSTQGLALSYSSLGDDEFQPTIEARSIIRGAIDAQPKLAREREKIETWIAASLRRLIYSGTDDERNYLRKLSQTYFLLFILKNDPHVVEFFNAMGQGLTLIVGSFFGCGIQRR